LSTASSPTKVLILTGPTASGKTELLDSLFGRGASSFFKAELALGRDSGAAAERAEIISADSMQAYRGLDIGTAKPDAVLRSRLPHHLIDIKNPDEQYTAGEFSRLADDLCAVLASKGVLPVISGGTGFYLRNFICGPPSAPPADPEIRREVAAELELGGAESLRSELAAADPLSAARIASRDLYRLTRAVEILRTTGRPPSAFAPSNQPRDDIRMLLLGLELPREELRARIDARVDAMFGAGLSDEVAALRAKGYGQGCPALTAIGYKEFFEMEDLPDTSIAEAIKIHTRQYAKRQITFLRALPGIVWINPEPIRLASLVRDFINAR
jgi:tRNA dimethylallyltransferase